MSNKLKRAFGPVTVFLILIGIVINGAGGWLVSKLNVPFYFDTIGTILVAVTAGSFAGALTGLFTNIILGFVSKSYIPYWPVPLLIGLTAGFFAKAGWFNIWWRVVIVGFVVAMVAATTSTLVASRVFGELDLRPAYFLLEEPIDKITSALIVFIVLKCLPRSILQSFHRPENTD